MVFYIESFMFSFLLSFLFVPLIRFISIKLGNYDKPSEIKTHKGNIPLSGGVAVFISFSLTLIVFRFLTNFPTGTLRELRYILIGSFFILLIGLIDDITKPKGIKAEIKFLIEVLLAIFMITRGFSINFIKPDYIAFSLTILWIVGITNALNIIDIMDGLSSSQILIAAIAFFLITMPSEAVYVNFLSTALAGAILGFIPYNMSTKYKIFLGDSGSLFCGFILAIISLGASYSNTNPLGVYAPLIILSVPIFDTFYVSYIRIKKGISPFKGTKDHFALRLEIIGFSRKKIVLSTFIFSVITSFLAYLVTIVNLYVGIIIYFIIFLIYLQAAKYLYKIKVD